MAKNAMSSKAPASEKYPRIYFFYGSLMDPTRLSSVLGLRTNPELLPATVTGYHLMLWGPYPALIPEAGKAVSGLAFTVRTDEDAQRLQYYETANYAPQSCRIELADGTSEEGWTFVWAGDRDELGEGIFDLEAWQTEEYGQRAREAPRLSHMAWKFMKFAEATEAARAAQTPLLAGASDPKPWREIFPKMRFLYGSLMDATVLSQILRLTDKPELRPAYIEGYRHMRHGPYSVLIREPGHILHGVCYMVQSLEDAQKLDKYEPKDFEWDGTGEVGYDLDNFETPRCTIQLDDGTEIDGTTLAWNTNGDELEDIRFDLADWQARRH